MKIKNFKQNNSFFTHQINLCVGKIFKESTELKVVLNNTIKLTTYFKNPNHKFFIAKL